MTYRGVGCFATLLSLGLAQSVHALDSRIEGLDGAVEDNVKIYLQGIEVGQYSRSRLENQVRKQTREAMRAYGYYEPTITDMTFVEDPPERVELTIDPGPRVKITVLDLTIKGDAQDDKAFTQALKDAKLKKGRPLLHKRYDSLKSRLAGLSLQRGYFDSRFTDQRMEVRPWEESARIYLTLDSGPRYRFGEVYYHGSQIDEKRLRKMLPFKPGDLYLAEELAEYNQRLSQSNWFSAMAIRPQLGGAGNLALSSQTNWYDQTALEGDAVRSRPDISSEPRISQSALISASNLQAPEDLAVPIDVQLTPAARHNFEIGVGYATDVGPRLHFSWEQPWLNSDGDSLNHDLFLSAPEQRFTGEYIIPLEDPLKDSYRLQYGFRSKDDNDTQSLEAAVELARRWEFDNGWIQSLYLRTLYEDFTQGEQEDKVLLYYPGISWTRVRTRNPRFPTWGDRQRLALEYSDTFWGSDATFFRTTADTQWIRMLGDDHRFVGRMGLGAISTEDFDKIPPSLRFFAGGDSSVRGYSYESLAPRDDSGKLRGGQQLFTASVEAQRRITGDWWGAAFVDTGDAFDDWWPNELNTGAGLGVRWVSPVGPIRFDIAHPFDDEDNSWRIHFAIGPEF
ncbi:outer membrane protein assembly factor [Pistricoccus aurantiacus]|uniref:Translocation and assembly module subunit TamA n=1 Tax=Pistricoccus aurantiacus TaxID=1883414 RepID=A0A5B8SUH3_9GAMM|nr:autotransporter assembly complex family protein [Pistricoccus aurantiacus]QEA39961.1 outer membrane protein assembly factor [Pistricoccus aurantiacus]